MTTATEEKQLAFSGMNSDQEKEIDLKMLIREEHHRAEIERLRAGYDGCGCQECQRLYCEIDLEKYGNRVIRTGD